MELATPGSASRHASVARLVTHCATRPGMLHDVDFRQGLLGLERLVKQHNLDNHLLKCTSDNSKLAQSALPNEKY